MKTIDSVRWLSALLLLAGIASAQTTTTAFTDPRDGQKYRAVKIGGQTWMAQNLNYRADSSWCYRDDEANCRKYGRLYSWGAAMRACPAGWYLPDTADWHGLFRLAAGSDTADSFEAASTRLKSKTGWDDDGGTMSGNGTDDFGFSALPGGRRENGYFAKEWDSRGSFGYWWSGTAFETNTVEREVSAYSMDMSSDNCGEYGSGYGHTTWERYGYSVRCVRDTDAKRAARKRAAAKRAADSAAAEAAPKELMLYVNEGKPGSASCSECKLGKNFLEGECAPAEKNAGETPQILLAYKCTPGDAARKKIVLKNAKIELEAVIKNQGEYVPENLRERTVLKSKANSRFLKGFNTMTLDTGNIFVGACYRLNIYDGKNLIVSFATNGHNFYDGKNKLMYEYHGTEDGTEGFFLFKYWHIWPENNCR